MKVFCILSDERAFSSKSPVMHTKVLKALGIDGVYVPFHVEQKHLREAVRAVRALNIAGANVTVPYKETVVPHLDGLSEIATAVGAVNTIVRYAEALTGHNTDAGGFMDALASKACTVAGKKIVVVGSGGAARSILYALKKLQAGEIVLCGRDREKTERMAARFGVEPALLDSLRDPSLQPQVVVNVSSVSSPSEAPELASLVSSRRFDACELVMDVNYGRTENLWRDLARSAGGDFMDGLPMLAFQARRSFVLWTGLEPDASLFLDGLKEEA